MLTYFQQNGYRLPVHPATLCIRRELALALGGWMALPGGEDTGLLLAASVVTDGFFINEPGLLYRKHPDQITAQADWAATGEWELRMHLIESRAVALRSPSGQPSDLAAFGRRQMRPAGLPALRPPQGIARRATRS